MRGLALILIPLLFWWPAAADTIVLKNGRRIVAETVFEEGDRIFYENESGRVSLGKAMVERIERGADFPTRSPPASYEAPDESAPAQELSRQIQLPPDDTEGILLGGKVDAERLEALATLAPQGELERQSAVNAFLLAAAYEARQRRLASAARWAEDALRLSQRDSNALLLASQIDIARQRYSEAVDHLLLAHSMTPDSADVLTLLGNAYYFSEGPEKALRYWEQAYTIRPDGRLQERIRQAQREEQVEGGFGQAQSGQFVLNWEGSQVSGSFSRQVLDTLEQHYRELETALDFSPREPITVILYASQQFADVTQAPGWVGALNDGKIRVPVQGLSSMTAELSRVLKHEMVHSFVHRVSEGRCPVWLNEGLAQMLSGDTLARPGPTLAQLYAASRQIPLRQLEDSFMGLAPPFVAVAYAESLAAVLMIQDQYGAYQLPQLLKVLSQGGTQEEALRQVLRLSYQDLEEELAAYLTRRFGRSP